MQRTQEGPILYNEEERNAVEGHIANYFGGFFNVFHEIASPDIGVDIGIVGPTPARPFFTLVTMGMGARRMHLPKDLEGQGLDRAELLICLPPEWNLHSSEENDYWPIRWLKILARLPGQEDTWLGWGHTVPNGEPVAQNTAFSGMLLELPYRFGEDAMTCRLPGGEMVRFYQVLPLYEEEMQFKVAQGTDALMERLGDAFSDVVDIHRANCCAPLSNASAVPPQQGKAPFPSREECIASNRIVADGCRVGFFYREKPAMGQTDSGWRFLAGDESKEYLGDPGNSGRYPLHALCSCDPEVTEFLDAPVGSAFLRGEDGRLHADEDWQPERI